MDKVRIGVVGIGVIGHFHCKNIVKENSPEFHLAAVCNRTKAKAKAAGGEFSVPFFTDPQKMFESGLVDAVIIATPHYWHAPLTIRAARAGLHVMVEKPLASTVGPAKAAIQECQKRNVVLAGMLQHRTRPIMIRIKQLVDSGEIGEVFRASMICSNWFRAQAYYDSGAWRGTWDGEGGGVLINQGPHHLDLFTWIVGLPKKVLGLLDTRAHTIEVEDTANFLCDYGGGKVGYIYATTAELPGMEQFMLCGDRATLVAEGHKLRIGRLQYPLRDFTMGSVTAQADATVKNNVEWSEEDYSTNKGGQHIEVIRAFAGHILRGTPLVASGADGLAELELSNAMYLAGYKNKAVELPVDEREIERLIAKLQKQRSTGKGHRIRAKAGRDLKKLLAEP
ncbi:MAG: Gfo/Idh/MocA family oxidoreductase [Phycisphaerae bacterium]|jgi:predicted dehydrogenase